MTDDIDRADAAAEPEEPATPAEGEEPIEGADELPDDVRDGDVSAGEGPAPDADAGGQA